ncbi:MAG TPA: phospholipase D-like domain-containing protein [Thermoanaerobaculia bacterium]|jgi:phosphatidylserine/phosphatidylglycerophosphate/cardiolipin synthase-like enzyme
MRVTASNGDFKVKAISGIRGVLLAIDCPSTRRTGLRGFAFKRGVKGGAQPAKWLRSTKVFEALEPDPKNAKDPNDPRHPKRFYTNDHPVQSFLWGDYGAEPDTTYEFEVYPMYGKPGALQPEPPVAFEIRTEKEIDQGHGVWFNRGAIASQKFAEEFKNKPPSNPEDPDDPEVKWLSRGLLDACLRYIDETPAGNGLRVAAYEFTYAPILEALKRALDRGVDVRIVYHDTRDADGEPGEAEDAIKTAELPKTNQGKKILFPRTKTKIPHNKFIVRLDANGTAAEVWTGSTNFTPSGFLGQSNVGHWLRDNLGVAKQYLDYWELLRTDPERDALREAVLKLTPDPQTVLDQNSIVAVFSPRAKANLLTWYAERMTDCAASLMFTAAFGVSKELAPAIAEPRKLLRFILMEKPAPEEQTKDFAKDRKHLILSYGVPLGEIYAFKNGKAVARKPIKDFRLVRWFIEEEHYRNKNEGFIFFVHTKFLLIDPLSDDPLVCSGSANFSSNSLLQNDENMLLIRGNTRVADIYMTEFDRLFRHFYFRDVANELEAKGVKAKGIFLDDTDKWSESYFWNDGFKSLRRQMFFADPRPRWFENAAARPVNAAKPAKAAKKGSKKATTKKSTTKKATKKKSTKKSSRIRHSQAAR